jgi:hypothetical protein
MLFGRLDVIQAFTVYKVMRRFMNATQAVFEHSRIPKDAVLWRGVRGGVSPAKRDARGARENFSAKGAMTGWQIVVPRYRVGSG